ncbi:MAG TPA: metal-sensitive transcriptional regulator [Bryobacteraceae bacterium]|jgi:DNA-binding FrmR family transcriptional regulator|nr:metal-sensitive transcriptional regulator [Bryobacteraceae bacterium]
MSRPHIVVACGCASVGAPHGRLKKAAAVDPEIKAANLRRLRRLEGQIRGLQKMIVEERYCPDIMIQISAAQEALSAVGRELMRNHLRHCVTKAVTDGTAGEAEAMYDEIVDLIYKHAR